MNNKSGFFSARNITLLAILIALVVVMQTFGASINIGPVQLNFTLIPIALGAIMLGKWSGALLGFACGVVVFIQVAMGLVPFYILIWNGAPVIATLTCIVKTTVAGFLAGLIYEPIAKKNKLVAVFVASAIVPIVNTFLFIIGCLLMWEPISTWAGGTNLLGFILVSLVTFNFFAELGVNLLVAPALNRVLRAVGKGGYNSVETETIEEQTEELNSENITDGE